MRVSLLRPNSESRYQINPPLSLGYLSAALKAQGITDVTLTDGTLYNLSPEQAASAVYRKKPYVIGVQVYSGSENWAREFTQHINNIEPYPPPYVVCGGPYVSADPWKAYTYIGCDHVIKGEGEVEFPILVNKLKQSYKKPYHAPCKVIEADLIDVNTIPIPDWDLLRPQDYFPHMQTLSVPLRGKRPAPIITSRGCPHRCKFCASHVTFGHTVRHRLVGSVLDEIHMLREYFDVDEIFFSDDNLLHDRQWAVSLFEAMAKKPIHWRAPNGIRYDSITSYMAERMRRSGCYYVGMGYETGSRRLQVAIRKPISMGTMRYSVRELKQHDIMVSGFYISGLPGETWRDRFHSIWSLFRIPWSRIQVSPFNPLPGSGFENESPSRSRLWNTLHTIVFYLKPQVIISVLWHFKWSQVQLLLKHPIVRGE